jgi:hypothetical protein
MMFGPVWPIPQWAGLGVVVGALFQVFNIMTGPAQAWSFNSGRLIGGMFVGGAIGAITAVVRNSLAAGK